MANKVSRMKTTHTPSRPVKKKKNIINNHQTLTNKIKKRRRNTIEITFQLNAKTLY